MTAMHKDLGPEDVHAIVDEVSEQLEDADRMARAIGESMGPGDLGLDDDELLAELDALADDEPPVRAPARDPDVRTDEEGKVAVKRQAASPVQPAEIADPISEPRVTEAPESLLVPVARAQ
jgi:hypothetical protein